MTGPLRARRTERVTQSELENTDPSASLAWTDVSLAWTDVSLAWTDVSLTHWMDDETDFNLTELRLIAERA